jgi:hypothetical protein
MAGVFRCGVIVVFLDPTPINLSQAKGDVEFFFSVGAAKR